MKRTYIVPNVKMVAVHTAQMMAESLGVSDNKLTGTNAGWAKEDNSWDIWGSDDED